MKLHRLSQSVCLVLFFMVSAGTSAALEKITYFHNDGLGSPVAATDETGNVLWREAYKPYGGRIRKELNSETNTTWYTGKQEDKASGLTYFGARWYDSDIGRFTGIDPVGYKEGNVHSFNRYAYANNNPYKFVDPDGNLAILLQKGSSIDFQMRNNASGVALNIGGNIIIGGVELGVEAATGRLGARLLSKAIKKLTGKTDGLKKEITKKKITGEKKKSGKNGKRFKDGVIGACFALACSAITFIDNNTDPKRTPGQASNNPRPDLSNKKPRLPRPKRFIRTKRR